MSRRIANLLNEAEETVAKTIAELEKNNGYPSHDARHIAEVHQRVRRKITDLGLDPDDTTAGELFHALQVKFDQDSRKLDEIFMIDKTGMDEKLDLAAKQMTAKADLPTVWALKNSAAKKVLCQLPPKHVMKYLRYRSIDSLLKRESICEVMLSAQALESDSWLAKQSKLVSKLGQTDFELRSLKIISLSSAKWGDIEAETEIVAAEAAGVLAIWPLEKNKKLSILEIFILLTEEVEKYGAKTNICNLLNNKIINWWADMDHLMAVLGLEHVSLNLSDVAASHRAFADFDSRSLLMGRVNYWRALVDRYENKLEIDGIFDDSLLNRVKTLNFKGPQPAFEYEYAEDL